MSNTQIANIVYPYYLQKNKANEAQFASTALVKAAQTAWKKSLPKGIGRIDDATCVIVFLDPPETPSK